MNDDLLFLVQFTDDQVGIGIACQQKNLEEQHAGRPDRWTSPVPWQYIFNNDRLYLEQQECTNENRDGKNHVVSNSEVDPFDKGFLEGDAFEFIGRSIFKTA